MAAKKPTKPRKFKQARKDAKSAAKQAFSGKSQAGLKDRTLRISADDKEVASEVRKEAKGNYITDDRGNKIQVKPTETPQERMARDRREAKAQLQQKWDQEDGTARKPREAEPAKKPAPKGGGMNKTRTFIQATEVKPQGKVIKKKAAAPAPAAEKPKVKKPAVKKAAAPAAPKSDAVKKGMTRAERSAANKAAWAKMTPAERKNWKGTKPAAAPAAPASAPTASKPMAAKTTTPKPKATAAPKSDKLKALQKKVAKAKDTAKPVAKTATATKLSLIHI